MTIQGAMKELVNLLNADDIPVYYKGGIEKVIETIDDYIDGKDDYVKRIVDRKTEPQTDCATCRHSDTWEAECRACDNYSNYEPRKENPQADMREREDGQ